MHEIIKSVGIDIGTSTTQLIFSELTIENEATSYVVPRINIVDKKVTYRSQIYFTPLLNQTTIDAEKVKEIIEKQNRHIDNTEQTVNEVMNEIETSVESIRSIENKTRELERSRTEVVNIIATLSDIAQQNVSSTQGTNEELKEVTDNFKNLDESARNLRSTADLLAANISNFKL